MCYLPLSRRFTATVHRDVHSFNLPPGRPGVNFHRRCRTDGVPAVLQARQTRSSTAPGQADCPFDARRKGLVPGAPGPAVRQATIKSAIPATSPMSKRGKAVDQRRVGGDRDDVRVVRMQQRLADARPVDLELGDRGGLVAFDQHEVARRQPLHAPARARARARRATRASAPSAPPTSPALPGIPRARWRYESLPGWSTSNS